MYMTFVHVNEIGFFMTTSFLLTRKIPRQAALPLASDLKTGTVGELYIDQVQVFELH